MRTRTLVVGLVAFALAGGCKKEPPPSFLEPEGRGVEGSGAARTAGGGATPSAVAGGQAADPSATRVPSTCPEGRQVSSGDTSTPEGTVYLAYQAVQRGSFDDFFALFIPEKNREDVKRSIWPNVQKFVGKYTAGPDDPSYVVCRRVPSGTDRVKLFVKCNDPQKSDPPIVLERSQDGAWRIDVMTP